MALITSTASTSTLSAAPKKKRSFLEMQRLAKQKSYEKQAKKKKIKTAALAVFTEQLASMLDAGLPLVAALEALQEQTDDPVFQIVIRNVRQDVASGTAFSAAVAKYPKAFPNLFISMVEAGEASGGLAEILGKVSNYLEETVKLNKKVKGAMTYPLVVIGISVAGVQVLLIKVIPTFGEMFADFGKELPAPTQMLLDLSAFLKGNFFFLAAGLFFGFMLLKKVIATPKGRRMKDQILRRVMIIGPLVQKVSMSRFCRTYAILLRSGVPILRTLEIVSKSSGNTYIELACRDISRNISQGGQLSETVAQMDYFPPTVKHMARAGEQTGNVEGMMNKIADFFDAEVETTVDSLTSAMEPLLILFLGIVVGGIVLAMFLPIFNMAGTVGGV